MESDLTYEQKVRRLPYDAASSSLNSFFATMTFGGAAFVLFLSELDLNEGQIGFIKALFPFTGLLALPGAPFLSRLGLKRSFVGFYGIRKFILLLLLLTPMVLRSHGTPAAFGFVAAVIFAFAVCRALAETAHYPWAQEYVPSSIRGRYGAVTGMLGSLAAAASAVVASFVIARYTVLHGYMILLVVGCTVGVISVALALLIPGGAPVPVPDTQRTHIRGMLEAVRDRNFVRYLVGLGCVMAVLVSSQTFVPLFMRKMVGLTGARVVLLGLAASIGGLVTIALWGWLADRHGGRPVAVGNLIVMLAVPVIWLCMPRNDPSSFFIAICAAALFGASGIGVYMGMGVCLYNTIVPPERKTRYMAVYYAWMGITGGCAPVIAGQALKRFAGFSWSVHGFNIDIFGVFFIALFVLILAGAVAFHRIHAGDRMPPAGS